MSGKDLLAKCNETYSGSFRDYSAHIAGRIQQAREAVSGYNFQLARSRELDWEQRRANVVESTREYRRNAGPLKQLSDWVQRGFCSYSATIPYNVSAETSLLVNIVEGHDRLIDVLEVVKDISDHVDALCNEYVSVDVQARYWHGRVDIDGGCIAEVDHDIAALQFGQMRAAQSRIGQQIERYRRFLDVCFARSEVLSGICVKLVHELYSVRLRNNMCVAWDGVSELMYEANGALECASDDIEENRLLTDTQEEVAEEVLPVLLPRIGHETS